MLGQSNGGNFDEKMIKSLKALQISGPLPLIRGQLYLPAPKDILVKDEQDKRQAYAIRPLGIRDGDGCDLS